jgi:hypothetical protein
MATTERLGPSRATKPRIVLDSNVLLLLSIGALLVANGLIARSAAAKEQNAAESIPEEPAANDRHSA